MGFAKFALAILFFASVAKAEFVNLDAANCDAWLEEFLKNLRHEILEQKHDPALLSDLLFSFNFTFLFTDHVGEINATSPVVIGLSTLERNTQCAVNYNLGLLRIDLGFKVNEIAFNSWYSMYALGLSPDGNVVVHITDQLISISLLIDVKLATGTLQHFEMPNDGKISIKLDGLGILGDAAANVVIAAIKGIFGDRIIQSLSDSIEKIITDFLANLDLLPPVPTNAPPAFLPILYKLHRGL